MVMWEDDVADTPAGLHSINTLHLTLWRTDPYKSRSGWARELGNKIWVLAEPILSHAFEVRSEAGICLRKVQWPTYLDASSPSQFLSVLY
jgi:hypothetical protein